MAPISLTTGEQLEIEVRRAARTNDGKQGEVLTSEPVMRRDLISLRDQVAWAGICQGVLTLDIDALPWQVQPGPVQPHGRLSWVFIEFTSDRGTFRQAIYPRAFARVARRATARLLAAGTLQAGDEYHYALVTSPCRGPLLDLKGGVEESASLCQTDPPQLTRHSHTLLKRSSQLLLGPRETAVAGPGTEFLADGTPVFCRRSIWKESHALARRGGENESAAAFVGELALDTESPAIALVINDVLPAHHAIETPLAVEFSGATWADWRSRVDQRRRRLGRPYELIAGTAHGHNFLPVADARGNRTCPDCQLLEECTRSTAHASKDDLEFHEVVFTAQPWAVLLVWGFNAREQEEFRLYEMRDGSLAPKPVYLLDD